jgi:hypothetical protein
MAWQHDITTKPAQAMFDFEKSHDIRFDWLILKTFCAEAGKQLCRGLKDRTIRANRRALIDGALAVFNHLQQAHKGRPVNLDTNSG